MARPISETTKFIMSLPTLRAKEVVAKAKAKGFSTSENNVHRVRRLHGTKRPSAAKSAGPGASPVASPAPKGVHGEAALSKSDFVRSFSASTTAKDIVAASKAKGIQLDLQYVYKIRSRSKPASAPTTKAVVVAAPATPKTAGASVEDLLRAVAAELGLGRAMDILQAERARVKAVFGG